MRLSKRLMAIAGCIPNRARVIDVGCDHALLDIYLTLEKKNQCIASDISSKVLEKTKEMIAFYQLEDQIKVVQSNGIEKIDVKEDDVLVIAGMGASTIIEIVSKNVPGQIIIQSNNDLQLVREYMVKKGFIIDREEIVFERCIYYVIISFKKGKKCYTKEEMLFGPILLQKKDKITKQYFRYLQQKKEKILSNLPANHKNINLLLSEIQILRKKTD